MASTTVYTYADLKTAIEGNNSIDYVYLGTDLISSGQSVIIPKDKLNFTIDGNGYSITDYNSAGASNAIRVEYRSGQITVTIKNLNFIGRNYYGMICFTAGTYSNQDILIIENVNYSGPQPIYHRSGITRIINSNFEIGSLNGSICESSELAECNRITFEGIVNISSQTIRSVHGTLYFIGNNGSLTCLNNSQVNFDIPSTYLIYSEAPVAINLEPGSQLTINSGYGMFYGTGYSTHIASTFTVGSNAHFTLYQTTVYSAAIASIRCQSGLELNSGSYFHAFVNANTANELLYLGPSSTVNFNDPSSVILYNYRGQIFNINTSSTINATTELLNTWEISSPLGTAGSIDDPPLHGWSKADHNNIILTATSTSTTTQTVTSNILSTDPGGVMNPTTFNLQRITVISLGRLPLEVYQTYDLVERIQGETRPTASVYAFLATEEEETVADENGHIYIILENPPIKGSVITIISNWNFLTKEIEQEVEGTVEITYLPQSLPFKVSSCRVGTNFIKRVNDNWQIIVIDSRTEGGYWNLKGYIQNPLATETSTLGTDSLVLIDQLGKRVFNQTPILIYRGTWLTPDVDETIIRWDQLEGILVEVDPDFNYDPGTYQTMIYWELEVEE